MFLSCLSDRCWFLYVFLQVVNHSIMKILTFQDKRILGIVPDYQYFIIRFYEGLFRNLLFLIPYAK